MPTVCITGASRGIGLELATRYADRGWRVLATARDPKAAGLQALANAAPDRVQALALDMANADLETAAKDLIGEPIDVLINNAGLFGGRPQTVADVDTRTWLELFRVNTIAPILLARALRPNLEAGKLRTLVTISSRMGSLGENDDGNAPMYRSSKSAVNMAMQCLALEWQQAGFALGVLLLHPGWVRTDMGTDAAAIDVGESAAGVMTEIDRFKAADRLAFRSWDGRDLPW